MLWMFLLGFVMGALFSALWGWAVDLWSEGRNGE